MTVKPDQSSDQGTRGLDAENPDRELYDAQASLTSATGAAKKVDRASRNTAPKFLDAAGSKINLEDFEKRICDQRAFYLSLTAGVGFAVGGGLATGAGVALLSYSAPERQPKQRPTSARSFCGRLLMLNVSVAHPPNRTWTTVLTPIERMSF